MSREQSADHLEEEEEANAQSPNGQNRVNGTALNDEVAAPNGHQRRNALEDDDEQHDAEDLFGDDQEDGAEESAKPVYVKVAATPISLLTIV